jgi:hypothetical protein
VKRKTKIIVSSLAILASAFLAVDSVRAEVPVAGSFVETPALETLWNNSQWATISAHFFDKVAETDPSFARVSLFFRGRASAYAEAYRIMGGTRQL